jgi:hypothetical protein
MNAHCAYLYSQDHKLKNNVEMVHYLVFFRVPWIFFVVIFRLKSVVLARSVKASI